MHRRDTAVIAGHDVSSERPLDLFHHCVLAVAGNRLYLLQGNAAPTTQQFTTHFNFCSLRTCSNFSIVITILVLYAIPWYRKTAVKVPQVNDQKIIAFILKVTDKSTLIIKACTMAQLHALIIVNRNTTVTQFQLTLKSGNIAPTGGQKKNSLVQKVSRVIFIYSTCCLQFSAKTL